MAILLCLSLDSCKKTQTQDAEGDTIEVANSEEDGKEAGEDSLDANTDSKIKAERMKKKDVILRKTKAQYVIY